MQSNQILSWRLFPSSVPQTTTPRDDIFPYDDPKVKASVDFLMFTLRRCRALATCGTVLLVCTPSVRADTYVLQCPSVILAYPYLLVATWNAAQWCARLRLRLLLQESSLGTTCTKRKRSYDESSRYFHWFSYLRMICGSAGLLDLSAVELLVFFMGTNRGSKAGDTGAHINQWASVWWRPPLSGIGKEKMLALYQIGIFQ